MGGMEIPDAIRQFANDVLLWIGFGTLVGLLAKAIMPGRDPGGALGTLLMGICGSVIGSGTLMVFGNGLRVSPVSVVGFVVATGGALFLLFFYRLLAGYFFREADDASPNPFKRRRSRRRVSVFQEE